MYLKKQLKELTIKDNFMFGAVMLNEENCRGLLEMVLGISIARVEVSREKNIVYHPEYKGVRLDIYAKDEKNTHYNIEMQVTRKPDLGRRVRYYHSQIDMELLLQGEDYTELPDTFVIFICDFDPFGGGKYCYTFETCCIEDDTIRLQEGSISIFLSTKGENDSEVSPELVKFLHFVQADLEESYGDFGDDYVRRLQQSVLNIKKSRKMEERYMLFEEMLRDERAEGRTEGRNEGRTESRKEAILKVCGKKSWSLSENILENIRKEDNPEILDQWFDYSLDADSMEEFQKKIQEHI